MHQNKAILIQHVKENLAIYLFMLILFITGTVFGAIIVNSMNFVQKQDLFFYLERFFGQLTEHNQNGSMTILKDSFFYHAKYLGLVFLLGLAVIGLPIVWILLFLKGVVVGFSVGFMVNQLGWKGLLIASLSIAPQNMFVIPIYIIAGSMSMIFSLTLINKLFSNRLSPSMLPSFGKYMIVFLFLIVGGLLAAGMEGFVSHGALKAIIDSLV